MTPFEPSYCYPKFCRQGVTNAAAAVLTSKLFPGPSRYCTADQWLAYKSERFLLFGLRMSKFSYCLFSTPCILRCLEPGVRVKQAVLQYFKGNETCIVFDCSEISHNAKHYHRMVEPLFCRWNALCTCLKVTSGTREPYKLYVVRFCCCDFDKEVNAAF